MEDQASVRVWNQPRTLEALSEVSRALASAVSLPEFFFIAIRAVTRAIGGAKGNIWVLDQASERIHAQAAYNIDPADLSRVNQFMQPFTLAGDLPLIEAIHKRQLIVVPDARKDARLREFVALVRGFMGLVVVPLTYGERTLGALSLYFPDHLEVDVDGQLFVQAVADQVSAAMVANERLRELQRANEALDRRTRELEAIAGTSAQHRLLATIIEELPAGVAFLDERLRIQVANPALLRALDLKPEQVIGRSVPSIAMTGADSLEGVLREVLESGEPFHTEMFGFTLRHRPEFGQRFWDLNCLPLRSLFSDLSGVLVLSLDVTDRRGYLEGIERQVKELHALDDMKDNFLAIVSHELRTPLNLITGFASILEDEIMGSLTADQHLYLQRILEGADRLLEIITNMLTFNRLQSGKVALFPEALPVSTVIEGVLARAGIKADAKHVQLRMEVPEAMPDLYADAESFENALGQLVDNAIKFTPAGGQVVVRARPDGVERLRIEVIDTGIGISPSVIPKLFTRFFQVDMTPTRQFGGTGLGLAIAKRLVQLMNGDIGVESQLGKGSTFWLALPTAGP